MDIKEIKKLKVGEVLTNVNIKKYTTYHAGGIATCLVIPKDVDKLIVLLKYLKENNIKHKILGNGSNLIFSDSLYDGVLIKLDKLDKLEITGNKIVVGAGYNLIKLAIKTANLSLTGLEFASGIPGTIGGAVFMNAGAYNSDMGYFVKDVKVLTPSYEIKTLTNKEMDFHYRSSFLQKNRDYVCLEATLLLRHGKKETILEVIRDRKERRIQSQPLEYPAAGSVFRNPEGMYAGKLIEDIGYKGKRKGDAMVSLKHANFIVNVGNASGDDIKALILEIKEKVKEEYNVDLKVEQEFVE